MTTKEVIICTGISGTTVNSHIQRGLLPAEMDVSKRCWEINTSDAMNWANELWQAGRVSMFPVDRIAGNMLAINDLRSRATQSDKAV